MSIRFIPIRVFLRERVSAWETLSPSQLAMRLERFLAEGRIRRLVPSAKGRPGLLLQMSNGVALRIDSVAIDVTPSRPSAKPSKTVLRSTKGTPARVRPKKSMAKRSSARRPKPRVGAQLPAELEIAPPPPVGSPERERMVVDFSEETYVDALGRLRTRRRRS